MSIGMQLGEYSQLRNAISFLKDNGQKIVTLPQELFPGMEHNVFVVDPDGHLVQLYFAMEQVGWDGRPRSAAQRPKIDNENMPEKLPASTTAYAGEVFFWTMELISKLKTEEEYHVKFLTYKVGKSFKVGVLDGDKVLDLAKAAEKFGKAIPSTMREIVASGSKSVSAAKAVLKAAQKEPKGLYLALDKVKIAAPLQDFRKNIFCVGRNYKAHIEEMAHAMKREVNYPKVPEFFSKPPTTVIGHEDNVERHAAHTSKLDYEVELAVVIGKGGRNIPADKALDHIFGYTVVNDVTARDAQTAHGQFFKGKSFDTYCPIGPYIVTKDEFGPPDGHRLTLKVNGKIRQDSSTSDLYHNVPKIIEGLSWALTLEPGDIIATGTPSGVAVGMNPPAFLKTGDVMEAEVEGIGILRNTVVD